MIGQLRGLISPLKDSQVIVDCQGVGYLVECSERTLKEVHAKPLDTTLLISTVIRDDAITLYGFSEHNEQKWFLLLQKVPGVAAKLSLHILSHLAPLYPGHFIANRDEKTFLAISGVGKKLASRIITELENHLEPQDRISSLNTPSTPSSFPHGKDAESALTNLGYSSSQASQAVARALEKHPHTTDSAILIKISLQELRHLLSPSSS